MYRYSLSLYGESVGICSKTNLSPIFDRWNKLIYLTGVEVCSGGSHEFIVEYNNLPSNEVHYSEKQVCINIPFEKLQNGELLFYSALPFLEVQRQRKSIVTMHAAAIEFSGKSILLLGKTGSGKTSIVLSLCLNNKARFIGNDIVNVGMIDDKIMTCSGSKFFRLRQESIKRNMPELLNLFSLSKRDSWSHKIDYSPDKLGISTCDTSMEIAQSYLVHVDESMDNLYVADANTMDIKLYLNENMSRYIRGTAISIFDENSHFMGYVPSYDLPAFFVARVKLVEALIVKTRMTYISGSLNDICQYIIS